MLDFVILFSNLTQPQRWSPVPYACWMQMPALSLQLQPTGRMPGQGTVPDGLSSLYLHACGCRQQMACAGCRWRPDRFMPGGEYDQFDDDLRLFRVRLPRWLSRSRHTTA